MKKVKICFIGDQRVGKTSLIHQLNLSQFSGNYIPTIGVDYYSNKFNFDINNVFALQIWDSAGQDRFRSLVPSYLNGSVISVLVFDITRRETFQALSSFLQIYQNSDKQSLIYLIGNKKDLEDQRQVSQQEGMAFCQKFEMKGYYELTANGERQRIVNFIKKTLIDAFPQQTSEMQKEQVQKIQDKTQKKAQEKIQTKEQEKYEQKVHEKQKQQQQKIQNIQDQQDTLIKIGLCQETLAYLSQQHINLQILQFMQRQDIKQLNIPIGDKFRIIMNLKK